MNDKELINSIVDGDEQAFSFLYEQYADKVYNTAISYSKNVQDAEEITQDVFVKVFRNAASFKGNSSLNTWIYRITTNTSLNYLKKVKQLSSTQLDVADMKSIDFNHPGVLLENKENAAALYKVMDYLPDSQRTAFILSYIEHLPRQEVASIMETTLKAVESLLQRAKRKMRVELEKTYVNRRK